MVKMPSWQEVAAITRNVLDTCYLVWWTRKFGSKSDAWEILEQNLPDVLRELYDKLNSLKESLSKDRYKIAPNSREYVISELNTILEDSGNAILVFCFNLDPYSKFEQWQGRISNLHRMSEKLAKESAFQFN